MAEGDEVKLLGARLSPYVMRARVALNIKGLRYEFIEESIINKSNRLLKMNPVYKKIPVLIHKGKPICESMIIVQYIDEVWSFPSTAILPADPYERAEACFWVAYADDKWLPAILEIVVGHTNMAREKAIEQLSAGFPLLEAAFERCSKGKGFFGGDTIGFLDIAIGGFLGWLGVAGKISGVNFLDEENTPLLAGWAERFRSHETVRELMPETAELLEVSKEVQAYFRATYPA